MLEKLLVQIELRTSAGEARDLFFGNDGSPTGIVREKGKFF